MNIQSAKEQIKDTVEAYLETDDAGMYVISPAHQRPVFLLGAPGIGKTAIMEQIAQELGIGIVSYSMTHHTRQSALGLPRIEHHDFEGYEYESSEYTMSEIIGAIYDYMERTDLRRGILFLDEINCVSETLYPSMLQFLQFKTFGKHKVPDGWVVVCAGNPPEYNKQVHEFDIVTLDRMREIDVEPDYAAFKNYAAQVGLHPAVTTFLETKKDCFYKVESKAGGGKSFVTTRGWEDLARVIALYEQLGKPVNRDLVAQFLRDEDIADQFAVYYALFEKYRSDYQVASILDGSASGTIKNRAEAADFDERVALLGLLLDALAGDCAGVLEQEGVVLELREVLRGAKDALVRGGAVDVAFVPVIDKREAALARKAGSGIMSAAAIRKERLAIAKLREFAARCTMEKTHEGDEAFHTLERAYKEEVAKIRPAVDAVGAKMDNAFAFVDECFGGREMLVFVAELATRKATTQYLAHYGNETYYRHNDQLQVDSARMGLEDRASLLAELEENVKSFAAHGDNSLLDFTSLDMGGAAALGGGAVMKKEEVAPVARPEPELDAASSGPNDVAQRKIASSQGLSDDSASSEIRGVRPEPDEATEASPEALRAYYDAKELEYAFTSDCKMHLPAAELAGKKVLDVGCRRGRGVYKISSMVGNGGFAMGVDWVSSYIQEAAEGADRAWHDSRLSGNNMEFRVAFPEDLIGAGIGSGTFDAVYVNNAITLFYDQQAALREFARVLKPGGLLIMETVFSSAEHGSQFTDAARDLGNSVQAALTEGQNLHMLEAAGFGAPKVVDDYAVEPDRGYKAGRKVKAVGGDDATYRAVCLNALKK